MAAKTMRMIGWTTVSFIIHVSHFTLFFPRYWSKSYRYIHVKPVYSNQEYAHAIKYSSDSMFQGVYHGKQAHQGFLNTLIQIQDFLVVTMHAKMNILL